MRLGTMQDDVFALALPPAEPDERPKLGAELLDETPRAAFLMVTMEAVMVVKVPKNVRTAEDFIVQLVRVLDQRLESLAIGGRKTVGPDEVIRPLGV